MRTSRNLKVALAAALLVTGGWVGSGFVGSAGAESAQLPPRGEMVTTYSRAAVTRADGPTAQLIGKTSLEDGTFHPLEPCRIVKTTGMLGGDLVAGEVRSLLAINVLGDFVEQGGADFDCGVPSTATAIHVNITAVNPKAKGHLRIYPYGADLPNASIVNFTPGVTIANAATVKICRDAWDAGLCDYDFSVFASAATDVIVDVMGYYEGPLMARVNADGTTNAVSLAVLAVEKGVGTGFYKVTFDRDVSSCVFVATPDPHDYTRAEGEVSAARWLADEPESVYVGTSDSGGSPRDEAFSLVVHC